MAQIIGAGNLPITGNEYLTITRGEYKPNTIDASGYQVCLQTSESLTKSVCLIKKRKRSNVLSVIRIITDYNKIL